MNDKCDYCLNYLEGLDRCKYCHFEVDDFYTNDDWDLLNLDDDEEWGHQQLLKRLHSKGVECLFADMFIDNIAFLFGCNATNYQLSKVLGVSEDVIYNDYEHMLVIINLFQEKYNRGLLDESDL